MTNCTDNKVSLKWLRKTINDMKPDRDGFIFSNKSYQVMIDKLKNNPDKGNIYIHQVYTYSEYKVLLTLTNKKYKSRLRNYGTIEELIYSYLKVTPGVDKYYRMINSSGKFITEKDKQDPLVPIDRTSNIIIIKTTQWDSLKPENDEIRFDVYVYYRNNIFEQEADRAKEAMRLHDLAVLKNTTKLERKVSEINNGDTN